MAKDFKPDEYVTPREFMEMVLLTAKDIGYFSNLDERLHPEDISINLSTVMQSFAAGMGEAIRRSYKAE